jgi:SurA N-terminal domain
MVMTLVGAGGGTASSAVLPSPEELPGNMVAVVSNVPVSRGRITKAEFQHALVLSAVQAGRSSVPRPGGNGYERLKRDAIGNLLEATWILGEAVEMGITVTRGEVAHELSFLIKRQSFKSEAEYLKFLREAHYTKRDVHERVELHMLTTRLQRRLQARIEREDRNEFEEQQAFREFVAEFNEKWRARTVCAPVYATDRCSNGPPPSA